MSKEKNQWSSNMSFILAMIGSAVEANKPEILRF